MVLGCRCGGRDQSWNLGHRRSLAAYSGRQSSRFRLPVWFGGRCHHLLRRFPLMVLFIIFSPIVAAISIMVGAPARKTALAASVLTFAAALFLLASFKHGQSDFQHVTSFTVSPEWRLSFTTGIDGLSLIMVLLATIVTPAAVWFAGPIDKLQNAFYVCLLFISGGATGTFRSLHLFFIFQLH